MPIFYGNPSRQHEKTSRRHETIPLHTGPGLCGRDRRLPRRRPSHRPAGLWAWWRRPAPCRSGLACLLAFAGLPEKEVALYRVVNTSLGGVIAFLASFTIWMLHRRRREVSGQAGQFAKNPSN